MTDGTTTTRPLRPLERRLRAAAPLLLQGRTIASEPATLLDLTVASVRASGRLDLVWLLLVTVTGSFPTSVEVQAARRRLELDDTIDSTIWLLGEARQSPTAGVDIDVRVGEVIVETDFSARHDLHTGIQRVVRSTLPHWAAAHDLTPVVWTAGQTGLRTLDRVERDRLLSWGSATTAPVVPVPTGAGQVLVPWDCTVILMEVPAAGVCSRLAALGQYTDNRLTAVGYDCIPVVSAGMVPAAEPERFVQYLEVVKYCSKVAGISVSAAAEFAGFAGMLGSQGLPGPEVVECALPVDHLGEATAHSGHGRPVVLCIGSFEPRKNQLAVIHACEQLWREGIEVELRLIGGGGWKRDVARAVGRLQAAGRPVSVHTAISEEELAANYASARFTVFVSQHEGYGLPVAESLAYGVPAITTNYGSTAEIAAGGGVLTVDPRNDQEILDTMRRLLTDDHELDRLIAEIGRRPDRRWSEYAAELWQQLVAPDQVAAPTAVLAGAAE